MACRQRLLAQQLPAAHALRNARQPRLPRLTCVLLTALPTQLKQQRHAVPTCNQGAVPAGRGDVVTGCRGGRSLVHCSHCDRDHPNNKPWAG